MCKMGFSYWEVQNAASGQDRAHRAAPRTNRGLLLYPRLSRLCQQGQRPEWWTQALGPHLLFKSIFITSV